MEGRAVVPSPLPTSGSLSNWSWVSITVSTWLGPSMFSEHPVPLICRHDKAGVIELDAGKFKRFEVPQSARGCPAGSAAPFLTGRAPWSGSCTYSPFNKTERLPR